MLLISHFFLPILLFESPRRMPEKCHSVKFCGMSSQGTVIEILKKSLIGVYTTESVELL